MIESFIVGQEEKGGSVGISRKLRGTHFLLRWYVMFSEISVGDSRVAGNTYFVVKMVDHVRLNRKRFHATFELS